MLAEGVTDLLFKMGGEESAVFCLLGPDKCFDLPKDYLSDGVTEKVSFLTHATSVTLCQYFWLYSWDCFQWSLKMIWEQLLSILFLIWWMKKVLEFSVYFTVFYFQEELKSELFRLETLYKKVHILSNFSALRKTCKIKLTNLSLI